MSKKTEETKERRAPVRAPEFIEARIKRDLRQLRMRLVTVNLRNAEQAKAIDAEIEQLESGLSEIQAEIAKQGSVFTEGKTE